MASTLSIIKMVIFQEKGYSLMERKIVPGIFIMKIKALKLLKITKEEKK